MAGRPTAVSFCLRKLPAINQCAIGQIAIERPSDVKSAGEKRFLQPVLSRFSKRTLDGLPVERVGRVEIYVERYPELGSRQPISTDGGVRPLWSRNGRELFFGGLDGRQMFAVPVQSGTTLVAGRPQVLFEARHDRASGGSRTYDIAPDGRFIDHFRSGQAETGSGTAPDLILVQNWFEELKRLVPRK